MKLGSAIFSRYGGNGPPPAGAMPLPTPRGGIPTVKRREPIGKIYYIGNFTGATPSDDPTCGTGKLADPNPHPCLTLPYWNSKRREILKDGDAVYFAPGLYQDTGSQAGTGNHCIITQAEIIFEGRTADDKQLLDYESVVIDVVGTQSIHNPCGGRPMQGPGGKPLPLNNFSLRSMKLKGGSNGGGDVVAGALSENILFDFVRFTENSGGPGLMLGKYNGDSTDVDCVESQRFMKNVEVSNSSFDNNSGTFGGFSLGCLDGFNVHHILVYDNRTATKTHQECVESYNIKPCVNNPDPNASCHDPTEGCDDRDGIQFQGAINGEFSDSKVYRNGEDGVDIGGHPAGKSHHIVIERVWSFDNSVGNFKASGSGHVTIKNSLCTGGGTCFEQYSCGHHIKLYNNTFVKPSGRLIQLWQNCYACEFVNNILVSNLASQLVFIDRSSTAPTTVWNHNVVVNKGTGPAISEDLGAGQCANLAGSTVCEDPNVPCPPFNVVDTVTSFPATPAGLASFKAENSSGEFLKSNSGEGDGWGTEPLFGSSIEIGLSAFRLDSRDTVAKDRGLSLVKEVPIDFELQSRSPNAFDIGLDEAP